MVALLASGLVLAAPARIDSARWWYSSRVARALGLSAAQTAQIQDIFASAQPEWLNRQAAFKIAERRFSSAMESDVTEDELDAACSAATDAEAARNKVRTLMLYRIYRVLTPTQRERLDALSLGSTPHALVNTAPLIRP